MTRIIMHGCNGRMGQVITGLLKEDENAQIVAGIDAYDGIKNDYPVFPTIWDCTVEADVIIDFASIKAVDDLLEFCIAKQIPCVVCTTGLPKELMEKLEETSKKVAILKSANMSLGINLFMKMLNLGILKLEAL